jgi:hypothetical protein
MAITNHERVGKGLELLKGGLGPFVDREFKSAYKDRAAAEASRFMGDVRLNTQRPIADWDAAALLKLMWDSWNDIFRKTLGPAERSLLNLGRITNGLWGNESHPICPSGKWRTNAEVCLGTSTCQLAGSTARSTRGARFSGCPRCPKG